MLCAAFILSGSIAAHAAAPSKSLIDAKVIDEVKRWLNVPVMYIAVDAQNERYAGIGSSEINSLDAQWRKEREAQVQPLIASTLNNPLSTYLTQVQAASGGLFSEIFVMDAKGLNVGQSSITSDFWQGDEAKFQKTYDVGPDAIFIDDPEEHEGTHTWRAQLNLTLVDQSGRSIGAATVEINLTELARRAASNK
ncbi:MAG: hypothetical protein EP335_08735 [Alphaproteobacteria bacterium]|nr:MAG: hypothetical protein EP335_08735 [Alphaproteobacteria bacterium]